MTLDNTRFGSIDYDETDILTVIDGLIGFSTLQRFVLLCQNPDSPFRWLQSIDEPALAFLLADPGRYVEGYGVDIDDVLAAQLGLTAETPTLLLTTATIPTGRPKDMTLNLTAPIVINVEKRLARQVVLENDAYTMRYRVFPTEARTGETAAA